VEAAITLPVIILMTMLVVQYALLWHGRHIAESAARDGLEAASGYQAPAGAGKDAVLGYLHDVAPHLLIGPDVNITRTATTVRVQVRARVLRVIPVGEFAVSESVQGPVERFVSLPASPSDADISPVMSLTGTGVTWL
jgi:hypothetical protein